LIFLTITYWPTVIKLLLLIWSVIQFCAVKQKRAVNSIRKTIIAFAFLFLIIDKANVLILSNTVNIQQIRFYVIYT